MAKEFLLVFLVAFFQTRLSGSTAQVCSLPPGVVDNSVCCTDDSCTQNCILSPQCADGYTSSNSLFSTTTCKSDGSWNPDISKLCTAATAKTTDAIQSTATSAAEPTSETAPKATMATTSSAGYVISPESIILFGFVFVSSLTTLIF